MSNILLAEDDHAVRDFVRMALEMDGHEVISVHDGEEALERIYAEQQKYDLLLTDIRMPVTDGIALVQKLQELNIPLPVLLMTALDDQEEKARDLGTQIKGFIIKPFTLENVREQVRSVLSNSASE